MIAEYKISHNQSQHYAAGSGGTCLTHGIEMKTKILLILVLLVSGCASTSGIVSAGKDKYLITAHNMAAGASGEQLKEHLYRGASEYCNASGKEFEQLELTAEGYKPFVRLAHAEMTFRCVDR
ncbi:hypothetical protein HGB07_06555 [Candidatus Roizmanbacteria bacterium]|nr:hypothetical protein [Candidatus Roizmanbacteria bacterium]